MFCHYGDVSDEIKKWLMMQNKKRFKLSTIITHCWPYGFMCMVKHMFMTKHSVRLMI